MQIKNKLINDVNASRKLVYVNFNYYLLARDPALLVFTLKGKGK